jgi:hypothetical protein
MKERPILFSGEMVRAILDGRKTQTRRVIKPQLKVIDLDGGFGWYERYNYKNHEHLSIDELLIMCPYGVPGDLLWVRETWCLRPEGYGYRADNEPANNPRKWGPSIYMPRQASRITLQVVGVRVERLQEIGESDAQAEGVVPLPSPVSSPESAWRGLRYVPDFSMLWNDINAARGFSWNANPWVWVVEFEKVAP